MATDREILLQVLLANYTLAKKEYKDALKKWDDARKEWSKAPCEKYKELYDKMLTMQCRCKGKEDKMNTYARLVTESILEEEKNSEETD